VVAYHLLGWAWLSLVFPSMGVMFALSGALVAASLDRGDQWRVLHGRLRRLLPSLWAMGLLLVPVMLWRGWSYDPTAFVGQPLEALTLLFWIVPLGTPPGSAWAANFVLPLWYLRTFLWLLLLSPALLWLFRRWPAWTVSVPLLVLATFTTGVVVDNGSRTDELVISVCTFAACWLVGFAHHDGRLRALPLSRVMPLAICLMVAGVTWALTHPRVDTGWNINDIPLANALYCLGAVLLLLRFQPTFAWLARMPVLSNLVTVFNVRALTIYLWGNVVIHVAIGVEQRWITGRWYSWDDVAQARLTQWLLTWAFLAVAVLLLGWIEDLAARRVVRINPWPRRGAHPRRSTPMKDTRRRIHVRPKPPRVVVSPASWGAGRAVGSTVTT
jgi:hypothetical protein